MHTVKLILIIVTTVHRTWGVKHRSDRPKSVRSKASAERPPINQDLNPRDATDPKSVNNDYWNLIYDTTSLHFYNASGPPNTPLTAAPDTSETNQTDGVKALINYEIQDVNLLRDNVDPYPHDHYTIPEHFKTEFWALISWMALPQLATTLHQRFVPARWNESFPLDFCGPVYEAFFTIIQNPYILLKAGTDDVPHLELLLPLAQVYTAIRDRLIELGKWQKEGIGPRPLRLQCPLEVRPFRSQIWDCPVSIKSGPLLWAQTYTSENLQLIMNGGGSDSVGVWWPGLDESTFSNYMGSRMLGYYNFDCTLESKCRTVLDCSRLGSRYALGLGSNGLVFPSDWGFVVLASMMNINEQLSNQYVAIKGAGLRTALEAFKADNFYPVRNQFFDVRNALQGLGAVFSIAGDFLPSVGPGVSASGTFLSAVSGFIGNTVSASLTPDLSKGIFASSVEDIYKKFVTALDDLATLLFSGQPIDGKAVGRQTIVSMMEGGVWLETSSLARVSKIEDQMKFEILSRSIDTLWKTPPKNKMWVTFLKLDSNQNTTLQCLEDRTGPQDMKFCQNGGIYYVYNYTEHGFFEAKSTTRGV